MKAWVCSAETGEILHEFLPIELFMGRLYWTAWCRRQFYTIVETVEYTDETIYYVK